MVTYWLVEYSNKTSTFSSELRAKVLYNTLYQDAKNSSKEEYPVLRSFRGNK